MFGILRHMSEYDQADRSNMAPAELVSGRILMVHKAIRRAPKHSDYSRLDSMMASTLDMAGDIVSSRVDKWVAQEQRTAAVIVKNQRQFVEERGAESPRQGGASEETAASPHSGGPGHPSARAGGSRAPPNDGRW